MVEGITEEETGPGLERIRQRGTLRVGYDPKRLPFSFFNSSGDLVGFDVELSIRLAQALDVELELFPVEWVDAQTRLKHGHIDVLPSMPYIDSLLPIATLCAPYMDSTLGFVVRDDRRHAFSSLSSLQQLGRVRLGMMIDPELVEKAVAQYLPGVEVEIVQLDHPRAFFENDESGLDGLLMVAESGTAWTLLYPDYSAVVPQPGAVRIPTAFGARATTNSRSTSTNGSSRSVLWVRYKTRTSTGCSEKARSHTHHAGPSSAMSWDGLPPRTRSPWWKCSASTPDVRDLSYCATASRSGAEKGTRFPVSRLRAPLPPPMEPSPVPNMRLLFILAAIVTIALPLPAEEPDRDSENAASVFLLPYFLGNGETGVYFAYSRDGLKFEWLNDGEVVVPAPPWGDESLTRDPSIVYHDGTFQMVWTTSWNSRSIGYATSKDLTHWSEPRKIDIWGDFTQVRNTWAPELRWDPEEQEFLILWSSTTLTELNDGDGSDDLHGYDHRSYASRTKDFEIFSQPALFFSPKNPEYSVIDPYIAHDDRGTQDERDDRWVMVIKHELGADRGGKNLRLTFSERMQGPYDTTLGPPIVGAGTSIVDEMGEGPSLFKRDGQWFLYWDAPESSFSYCLATSPDLKTWTNRSAEMSLPAKQMRHGTVLVVPASAVSQVD